MRNVSLASEVTLSLVTLKQVIFKNAFFLSETDAVLRQKQNTGNTGGVWTYGECG